MVLEVERNPVSDAELTLLVLLERQSFSFPDLGQTHALHGRRP